MFAILVTMAALHSPPVLPPPPPPADNPPAQAEPTLDELVRNAPAEIRQYIDLAEHEQAQRLSDAKAVKRQLEHDLRLMRSGRIVPQAGAEAVRFITSDGPARFEFSTRDAKAQAIRSARSAIEMAEADARYFGRDDIFVQPVIAKVEIGAMGRLPVDAYHRYIVVQVIDGANALISCEYRLNAMVYNGRGDPNLPSSYGPDLQWKTHALAWLEGIDTARLRNGVELEVGGAAFTADRNRTYQTANGGSNTVVNLRRLELERYLPRDLIAAKGEPQR